MSRLALLSMLVCGSALAEGPEAPLPGNGPMGVTVERPGKKTMPPPLAIGLHASLKAIAFTDDGTNALVRSAIEGGADAPVESFEIWSTATPNRQLFDTAKTCAASMKALEARTKALGFHGVTVQAARCGKKGPLVVVDKKQDELQELSKLKGYGNKLNHKASGVEIHFLRSQVSVFKDEHELCTYVQPQREVPTRIVVGASKTGRLVYIVEESNGGNQTLMGVCGAATEGAYAKLSTATVK